MKKFIWPSPTFESFFFLNSGNFSKKIYRWNNLLLKCQYSRNGTKDSSSPNIFVGANVWRHVCLHPVTPGFDSSQNEKFFLIFFRFFYLFASKIERIWKTIYRYVYLSKVLLSYLRIFCPVTKPGLLIRPQDKTNKNSLQTFNGFIQFFIFV